MSSSPLLSAEVLRSELAVQRNLASYLLQQASDAYAASEFGEAGCAAGVYDETQAKIADLEQQVPIANSREAFIGRLAQSRPHLGVVTVSSVAFGRNTRHRRVEQINLANHR